MPNGHRRGHQVTRNGRTFHRSGSTIRRPKTVLAVGALAVGCTLVGGSALIGHPVILTGVLVGVAAICIAPYASKRIGRSGLRWGSRKAKSAHRWFRRRWQSHPNRQQVIRRAPAPKPQPAPQWQPELWGTNHMGSGKVLS